MGCLAIALFPPARAGFQHQLPWRGPGLVHAQLLQGGKSSDRAVLPDDPTG